VLVATEIGMLHQLRQANRGTVFEPVNPRAACPYMKMSTPEKLLRALREGRDEVTVDPAVAARARAAVEAMVRLGTPSPVGE
jgi:quinolinate synthase